LNLNPNFTVINEYYEKIIVRDISHILRNDNIDINKEQKNYREASAKYLTFDSDFSSIYHRIQFNFYLRKEEDSYYREDVWQRWLTRHLS
jgi:hypothetical protein